jgi:hypothetical protein
MQPMGRKPSRFPGKVDHHPKKGYVNWWEKGMSTNENKKASRHKAKNNKALQPTRRKPSG